MNGGHVDGGEPLTVGRDRDRVIHFLAAAPVYSGAALELLVAPGIWLLGRYEWWGDWRRYPQFYVEFPSAEYEVALPLPAGALLRWPSPEVFR